MLAPAPIPTTPSRLGDDWWEDASISSKSVIGESLFGPSPSGTVIGDSRLPARPQAWAGPSRWGLAFSPLPGSALGDITSVCLVRLTTAGYP